MLKSALPPEVISLIHHVELNNAGWWEAAIQQLILGTLWMLGGTVAPRDLVETFRTEYSVNLDLTQVLDILSRLSRVGTLVSLPDGQFKVPEQTLRQFERDAKEFEDIQTRVESAFAKALSKNCPSLDPKATWASFNERLFLPMIRSMGARTYELISSALVEPDKISSLIIFLEDYPTDIQPHLRNAIISFLDPKSSDVRSFILRHLNAYFFIEASNLKEDTLKALGALSGHRPSFKIFVDTNFLLSILGLHDNPSNEAALSLISLIKGLSTKVDVKLYVFPLTIDETKAVLWAYRESLKDIRLTPVLAAGAAKTDLRGIARKYVEESLKSRRSLIAADYFDPYIKDLIRILREKGVELFSVKVDDYRTRQDVVDDILQRLEFEKKKYGDRAKDYDKVLHDMVLWHFVHDKRPARVESPLQSEYWVVTVDFRMLGFDAFKRRSTPGEMPIYMHPSALIQMLQFWIPRTPEFEETIIGCFRLPFLFQAFDIQAEKVTIRILETLSRFENVDDLTQGTIVDILTNEVLRQKLFGEKDIQKQIELVRDVLIDEYKKTKEALSAAHKGAENLKAEVNQKTEEIVGLQSELGKQSSRIDELELLRQQEDKFRKGLETQLRTLKSELAERDDQVKARSEKRRFAFQWVVIPAILILLFGLAVPLALSRYTATLRWTVGIEVWGVLLIVWLLLIDRRGVKSSVIMNWYPFRVMHSFKRWLLGALGTGILANALWEWIKSGHR